MICDKGVVTAGTSNGNTNVVDLSGKFSAAEPLRALIVWTSNLTAAGTGANGRFSMGYGTNDGGSIQQLGTCLFDLGGDTANTDAAHAINNTWILRGFSDATPTLEYEIDLTAFSDTGFTLTMTDAPATAIRIHYFAIGGSDVSAARCGATLLTTGTGAQDITVVSGFGQPNLVFAISSRLNVLSDGGAASNGAQMGFGVASSDTVRQASSFMVRDATAAADCGIWQKQRMAVVLNNNVSYAEWDLGAVAGFPTDGFEVNKVVHPATNVVLGWLALKGTFSFAIGTDTALTAGSTDDLAAGFLPAGALLWGTNIAATAGTINTTNADNGQWFLGATDGQNTGNASYMNDDAKLTIFANSQHGETMIVEYYTPVTPTKVSEASVGFVGTNVQLTWSDLDTVAREYAYIILGPAIPPVPYVNPMPPLIAQ